MKTYYISLNQRPKIYLQGILFFVLLVGGMPAYAQWERVHGGVTPSYALPAGNENDGSPLYIARIRHEGGIHIGKVRANAREAFIPYGGKEIIADNFEIYTGKGRWVTVSGGNFPANAIVGGYENDNSPLYIVRASIGGGLHIGKARANAREAFIPYGGTEEIVSNFQVLTR
ncbi:DUF3421 domain-containing protein [Runella sp.]|uniref:DUF3421 domain-containing protein n=1 Tax=Runella sp. TaxID=1960881 RepID=UPI003D0B5BAF